MENLKKSSRIINPKDVTITEKVSHLNKNKEILVSEYGETFHQIFHNPQAQFVLGRILKGHIQVADIIYYKDKFYSYEPEIDNFEIDENVVENITLDISVLNFIFNDKDHLHLNAIYGANRIYYNGKYYIFDLGAGANFWDQSDFKLNERIDFFLEKYSFLKNKLLEKLSELLIYFSSKDIIDILNLSIKQIDGDINKIFPDYYNKKTTAIDFQNEIIRRIKYVQEKIK